MELIFQTNRLYHWLSIFNTFKKTLFLIIFLLFGSFTVVNAQQMVALNVTKIKTTTTSATAETKKNNPVNHQEFKNTIITVKIKGIVCAFCAQGITKTFNTHKSVKKADINLETGTIRIHLKKDRSLFDHEIQQIIEDAGYEADDISAI
tara:strand:+ start:104 stop:550 length:447 start_codon:yes stop_codon:yes gene_type:complete